MSVPVADKIDTGETDEDVEESPDEDLPVFSTLLLGFGSILATVIVVWYALQNIKTISDAVIQLSQRGVANVTRLANTVVNQTKVYVLQALPQIEHAAVSVFNALDAGVESSFNSIGAVTASVVSSAVTQFAKLASLIGDFGQQIASLFLQSLAPTFQTILSFCQDLQQAFDYTSTLYLGVAAIVNAISNFIHTVFGV